MADPSRQGGRDDPLVASLDRKGNVIAVVRVAEEGEHFGGTIDLEQTPRAVRTLFEEFEEIVNGQMFSFLDAVQDNVRSLAVTVRFECGCEAVVQDLQVYPSAGEVSFKLGLLREHAAQLVSQGLAAK